MSNPKLPPELAQRVDDLARGAFETSMALGVDVDGFARPLRTLAADISELKAVIILACDALDRGFDIEQGCALHGDFRAILKPTPRPAADPAPPVEKMAPVQGWPAGIPWSLHLEAYAAYSKKWSPQPALIEGGCRGGFHTGELDDFIPGWRERATQMTVKARAMDAMRLAALKVLGEVNMTAHQRETIGTALHTLGEVAR